MANSYNVLFLCTGNSARSIMAEAILNHLGKSRFKAYSAGSHPTGTVRPEAIVQLQAAGFAIANLRSKSWEEFSKPGAPHVDLIVTVCDSAANEICPVWPGKPTTAHWPIPDPAAAKGSAAEIAQAFRDAFVLLERRINSLLSLPDSVLQPPAGLQMQITGKQ